MAELDGVQVTPGTEAVLEDGRRSLAQSRQVLRQLDEALLRGARHQAAPAAADGLAVGEPQPID